MGKEMKKEELEKGKKILEKMDKAKSQSGKIKYAKKFERLIKGNLTKGMIEVEKYIERGD